MSSLDKLCFILVERQKANALRRRYLSQYHTAEKNLKINLKTRCYPLKNKETAKQMKAMKDSYASYRRVADLMNEQRPLLRLLRKETGARMKYDGSNTCCFLDINDIRYSWEQITQFHNSYVFECVTLTDSKIDNPYAKELYGKETKSKEIAEA